MNKLNLRNGTTISKKDFDRIHKLFLDMSLYNKLAKVELVHFCQGCKFPVFAKESLALLLELGLLQRDSDEGLTVAENVKNVVLSSAKGRGLSISYLSPLV